MGARRGVAAAEVLAAVDRALSVVGGPVGAPATPATTPTTTLATLDRRAAEPGLVAAARARGWTLTAHSAAELAAVGTPTWSARVAAAVGTGSVAEAAALAGGGQLVVPRTVHGRVTVAVAVR